VRGAYGKECSVLKVLLHNTTDGPFFFALVMLNGSDDADGDKVVMEMMIYLIDNDDCICMICMITKLNSPSIFRM
jgi:hypothetical protein